MSQARDLRTEPGVKRVRAMLHGHPVFDTVRPLLVWESPYYPHYYIPREDVQADLEPTGDRATVKSIGEAEVFDVVLPPGSSRGAAREHREHHQLTGYLRFDWDAFDAWFEEDEEVFTHPRDPYTRVDILASSRHVVIEYEGVRIAESRRPYMLFETGLRPRYYLRQSDVRMDLLKPSDLRTYCPYKGESQYWSIDVDGHVLKDAVWSYRTPLPESAKVAGLLCFWPERSKRLEIYVDGERVGVPHR